MKIHLEQNILPYFIEKAPGALFKKSDFLGGGERALKSWIFLGVLFRGGHLSYFDLLSKEGDTFSRELLI